MDTDSFLSAEPAPIPAVKGDMGPPTLEEGSAVETGELYDEKNWWDGSGDEDSIDPTKLPFSQVIDNLKTKSL